MLFSIIGTFLVKAKKDDSKALLRALRTGTWTATGLILLGVFFTSWLMFGIEIGLGIFLAVFLGLLAGNVIAYFTEYYTSDEYKPTQNLSKTSETGPATIIIGGISLGMKSTVIPILSIVIATIGAFGLAGGFGESLFGSYTMGANFGLFGIGIAAVGMLSTLGITLATDAYGPVADNAGGIAEMSHLESEVRRRTDMLDSLGNTTAATGKGFAIGSAALTALALIATFSERLIPAYEYFLVEILGKSVSEATAMINQITTFNITEPLIIAGLFIGAVLPFIFSAMTMGAVGRAASKMVMEVRRQFKEMPGILDNKEKPDYKRCVEISTAGAQKEMVAPSLLAVASPIVIGILLGPASVVAMLSGSLISGFALAVMMANSGGAWDNAKKYIESGHHGGKGSTQHKAAVVGDTVGDPFKDTSGPSINILLKLMSIVSIIFAPAMVILNLLLSQLFGG
jgi:K(+)-stimulated pyrophosphate-energized sodium pump